MRRRRLRVVRRARGASSSTGRAGHRRALRSPRRCRREHPRHRGPAVLHRCLEARELDLQPVEAVGDAARVVWPAREDAAIAEAPPCVARQHLGRADGHEDDDEPPVGMGGPPLDDEVVQEAVGCAALRGDDGVDVEHLVAVFGEEHGTEQALGGEGRREGGGDDAARRAVALAERVQQSILALEARGHPVLVHQLQRGAHEGEGGAGDDLSGGVRPRRRVHCGGGEGADLPTAAKPARRSQLLCRDGEAAELEPAEGQAGLAQREVGRAERREGAP
mmetsp:Transcript_7938/g.25484  ORF Transcript_7938/g.25484 Transcript_7938/m.25484 type:complete len:277 (+) Transcript_7938:283-1113(+)